jgi:hypothetical protein
VTKHIIMLADRNGRGVYGVGDTHEAALATARSEWKAAGLSGRPRENRHRTVEVAAGSRLRVQPTRNGVEWWMERDLPAEKDNST